MLGGEALMSPFKRPIDTFRHNPFLVYLSSTRCGEGSFKQNGKSLIWISSFVSCIKSNLVYLYLKDGLGIVELYFIDISYICDVDEFEFEKVTYVP